MSKRFFVNTLATLVVLMVVCLLALGFMAAKPSPVHYSPRQAGAAFHNRPAILDANGWMWEFKSETSRWVQIQGQPIAFKNISSIFTLDPDCQTCAGYGVYNVGAIGIDNLYYQQTTHVNSQGAQVGPWIQLPAGPDPSGFWFVD